MPDDPTEACAQHEPRPEATAILALGGWSTCVNCGAPIGEVPPDVADAWRVVELMREAGGHVG